MTLSLSLSFSFCRRLLSLSLPPAPGGRTPRDDMNPRAAENKTRSRRHWGSSTSTSTSRRVMSITSGVVLHVRDTTHLVIRRLISATYTHTRGTFIRTRSAPPRGLHPPPPPPCRSRGFNPRAISDLAGLNLRGGRKGVVQRLSVCAAMAAFDKRYQP